MDDTFSDGRAEKIRKRKKKIREGKATGNYKRPHSNDREHSCILPIHYSI